MIYFTPFTIYLCFQVFSGNSDRYTVVSHVLPTPITARYIRIHPGAWHGHVSMRADFYGCPGKSCMTLTLINSNNNNYNYNSNSSGNNNNNDNDNKVLQKIFINSFCT